ncbi:MBL fold metallo-hydrolase [Ectothiorhodospiraceae bacterium 2226]|nr:MBL fold metallo-hydrolase [Ectothiorhodospiraceae bacterium 2226]
MRFCSLGSGSRGNGLLVEHGRTRLLVDCGFTLREVKRRLERAGIAPDSLSGILVTHEHSDHASGVGPLARKYRIPVWMTLGTARRLNETLPSVKVFNCHEPFAVDDVAVDPFPVPHDAREPAQFVFHDGAHRLGLLTDTGSGTPHIVRQLDAVDALVLECNYDEHMLAEGPYPPALKRRVGGRFGHLSNVQAAAILCAMDHSRLQHLVGAHLSEKNNVPALARAALAEALDCTEDWITLAEQDAGFGWRAIM